MGVSISRFRRRPSGHRSRHLTGGEVEEEDSERQADDA
jgi:hypothetical protein